MKAKMTVHLILNAHIDPVWLWPWQEGLDEVLATCRSACDLLDADKELTFTRGEAWAYRQVERLDPELFRRIRQHVKSGRWEIVGGWWIQPDCNLPSGFAMERQIELGKRYFLDRFGFFPRVGYNVDSFGHAATLPGYLQAAGQDRYVIMRPMANEMKLPARVFRWRVRTTGPEVVTFRIANAYCTREMGLDHVRASLTELPEGITHTMCFVGVGDHGGGPTRKQIDWCRQNRHAIPGCQWKFSTVQNFFDAIEKQVPRLPLVTGELQMHAIGCYTVHRAVKAALRRTEHRVMQAEQVTEAGNPRISEAWEKVCFSQFHDTLGGSAIPTAYEQVNAQLGFAECVADEILQYGLREKLRSLPDDPLQRLVLFNASEAPFDNWVEAEPWLEWQSWQCGDQLLDERSRPLPIQLLASEQLVSEGERKNRLLFKMQIPPQGLRVLRIRSGGRPLAPRCGKPIVSLPSPVPRLVLAEDTSDTWSHGLDRYGQQPIAAAHWERPVVVDRGPLMSSRIQHGMIGQSRLTAEWRSYAGENFIELRLQVHWLELHKILKLVMPLTATPRHRTDGILGGHLDRANDGRELPLRDWMLINEGTKNRLGIVCPDVYAADATPRRVRLTLLRSAMMAQNDPPRPAAPRFTVSDQGPHAFRFRFFRGQIVTTARLERESLMLHRPPLLADVTRGMPPRANR
jgi:alpha-mannosidase